MQCATLFLDRHHSMGRMLVVAGIGGKIVDRARIRMADLLPRVLVGLHLRTCFLAPLAEWLVASR
jgi:hypothetical protein